MRFWSDREKEPKKKNESCITESQQLQKIISGFRVGSVNDGRILNGIDYRIPSRIMSLSAPLKEMDGTQDSGLFTRWKGHQSFGRLFHIKWQLKGPLTYQLKTNNPVYLKLPRTKMSLWFPMPGRVFQGSVSCNPGLSKIFFLGKQPSLPETKNMSCHGD